MVDDFEYRSYRVHCYAQAISTSRFASGLVITRVTPERLLERHFPQVASFASKRDAFEHARAVGMAWIDAQEAPAASAADEVEPIGTSISSGSAPTPLSPPTRLRRSAAGLRPAR